MVIRLSRSLGKERHIPLIEGVSFTFKAFSYADYKEAEAWAHRTARERLTGVQEAALAGMEADELGGEFQDRLVGLASEMLLDRLVTKFGESWTGVEWEDTKEPVPLTLENWEMFRKELPVLADLLDRQLQRPMHVLVSEGNASAPLPSTSEAVG